MALRKSSRFFWRRIPSCKANMIHWCADVDIGHLFAITDTSLGKRMAGKNSVIFHHRL